MDIVYENIKKRRKDLNMTQRELAEKCGYKDHTTINAIEHGRTDITLKRLQQIAAALGTTVAALFGLEEEEK